MGYPLPFAKTKMPSQATVAQEGMTLSSVADIRKDLRIPIHDGTPLFHLTLADLHRASVASHWPRMTGPNTGSSVRSYHEIRYTEKGVGNGTPHPTQPT